MRKIVSVLSLVAVALCFMLVLAGCMAATSSNSAQQGPTPEPGKLTIANATSRPVPVAGGNGIVYMDILNGTQSDDRLVDVTSSVAPTAEMHETVNDNGVMRMLPQPNGFVIPAGGSVELKPGGKHIMLLDVAKPLAVGDTLTVTLKFEHAGPMQIRVPVVAISDTEKAGGMDNMNMPNGQK